MIYLFTNCIPRLQLHPVSFAAYNANSILPTDSLIKFLPHIYIDVLSVKVVTWAYSYLCWSTWNEKVASGSSDEWEPYGWVFQHRHDYNIIYPKKLSRKKIHDYAKSFYRIAFSGYDSDQWDKVITIPVFFGSRKRPHLCPQQHEMLYFYYYYYIKANVNIRSIHLLGTFQIISSKTFFSTTDYRF